ncbi:MAG: DUF1735 domain-containing protein [Alistipes sp.]|nr:DUF1735 domain-containing protein [Alistipes sp.]
MKKLYIILCVALALTLSCQNNRDNNLTEAHIYIVNSGLQSVEFYDLDTEPTASVAIHRSGYFGVDATVNVEVSEQALIDYNAVNGTDYQMLDTQSYLISTESIAIGKNERGGNFEVQFNYDAVATLEEGHKFVVPLLISSNLAVTEGKEVVLLSPKMLPAEIFFAPNKVETVRWSKESTGSWSRKLTVSVPFVNPTDVAITFDTSKSAFDLISQGATSWYNLAPADAFQITGEAILPAGSSELTLTLEVDFTKLPSVYRCSIPVVLTANSENFAINQSNFYYLLHLQQDGIVPTIVDAGDRRQKWSLLECNSCHGNMTATTNNYFHMIDGDATTFWHSGYNTSSFINDNISCSADNPYIVAWNLEAPHNLVAVELTRRSYKDYIAGYFEVSEDGYTWSKIATFDHIAECGGNETLVGPYRYEFNGDANVQYVRVCVTNCQRGTAVATYANIAEFNVLEATVSTEE